MYKRQQSKWLERVTNELQPNFEWTYTDFFLSASSSTRTSILLASINPAGMLDSLKAREKRTKLDVFIYLLHKATAIKAAFNISPTA